MIEVRVSSHVLVVVLSGDIDLVSEPTLSTTLTAAVVGEWRSVLVDCRGLNFIDVAGTRSLVVSHHTATERGVGFFVVDPSRAVIRLLDFFGIHDAIVVTADTNLQPARIDTDLPDAVGTTAGMWTRQLGVTFGTRAGPPR